MKDGGPLDNYEPALPMPVEGAPVDQSVDLDTIMLEFFERIFAQDGIVFLGVAVLGLQFWFAGRLCPQWVVDRRVPLLVASAFALLCVSQGAYLAFMPRGDGAITANRVIGFLLYVALTAHGVWYSSKEDVKRD